MNVNRREFLQSMENGLRNEERVRCEGPGKIRAAGSAGTDPILGACL